MKKRKVLALVVALAMVFMFVACDSGGGEAEPAPEPEPAPAAEPATEPEPEPEPEPAAEPAADDKAWNIDNITEQTFILAHGMPETGMTAQQYHEFVVKVDELSEGKLNIEERINGTLVTDTESFDALLNGTVDFIHSMGSYVTGTVTDLSPMTIAGYYGGSDWKGFAKDIHDPITDIYGDYGVKYLGALAQGNSVICCTERQIKSPSDVAGLTFRASGEWVSKTVSAWGGAATTIGLADLADAFSKKSVQGVATGLNIIVPFKIYEVTKYVTRTSMSEGFAALLMNGERWESLNADEQALLTEAAQFFQDNSYDMALNFMEEYMAEIEGSGLNEVYVLNAEEQQEFVELAYSLYDEMAGGLGQKGLDLMELMKKINGIA